jgi:hypothetical protein
MLRREAQRTESQLKGGARGRSVNTFALVAAAPRRPRVVQWAGESAL